MANVKITELVELSAADLADVDVFPIVDVGADTTKKVTIASLKTGVAFANDFVTFTAAVAASDAVEARRVANVAGAVSTITTGNLATGRALVSDGSGKVAGYTGTIPKVKVNHLERSPAFTSTLDRF